MEQSKTGLCLQGPGTESTELRGGARPVHAREALADLQLTYSTMRGKWNKRKAKGKLFPGHERKAQTWKDLS